MSAVPLREDFSAADLRLLAKKAEDPSQARRLLSLAAVREGKSRSEAARTGAMDRQTLRDWVHRFNAEGPSGLINAKLPGPKPKLSSEQRQELKAIVEKGPDLAIDGVVRWRCCDLKRIIKERFAADVGKVTVWRMLKQLGFSHVSPRPLHPKQKPEAIEDFKKIIPAKMAEFLKKKLLAGTTPIEIWFQDEMRVGQKNGLVYQWAKTGTRPRQPKDQRYANAYLFGAVCPARDTGVGLVLPYANTEAMQHHLQAIGRAAAPGAHAVVLLDKAAWHTTRKLEVPENISLLPLPPASPELNPQENIWQFLRHNFLSNRVFAHYEAVVEASADAWNKLIQEPGRIASIATRSWAISGQPP